METTQMTLNVITVIERPVYSSGGDTSVALTMPKSLINAYEIESGDIVAVALYKIVKKNKNKNIIKSDETKFQIS